MVPQIRFPRAEHHAFFYEDTHLMLIVSARGRRLLFLLQQLVGEEVQLEDPGELYENQVRDAIDRIFFVEMSEQGAASKKLVLGAYFPVGQVYYGAYYERGTDQREIFFMRVIGEGDTVSLAAVEDAQEHELVARGFMDRYQSLLA